MKKDSNISVALEMETYTKLVALAKEDNRRVGNLVRHIIKLYIRGVAAGNIKLSVYQMNDELYSI